MRFNIRILAIGSCITVFLLAGCATQSTGQGAFAGAQTGSDSEASTADSAFARQACQAAAGEVEIARLAALNTKTPEVRRFAERLEKEHLKADRQLAEIFAEKGMAPEDEFAQYVETSFERLSNLKGGAFDAAFKHEVIRSHERAINLYQNQAAEGEDPALKQFAQGQLPKLKSHLEAARELPVSSDLKGPEPFNPANAAIHPPVGRSVQIGR